MLFVSVGLVKAAVKITIPKGETATLAVTVIPNTDAPAVTIGTASTPAYTFKASGSYTVPKDDKAAQEIEISNTFSALTITGKATVLRVGNKAIETITASGIGLESLEIAYAGSLKTLNVSNNALTSIDVSTATALETLNISGNPGISMGVLPTSLVALDISGNKFSVTNNAAWNLSSYTKLKELKLDGNLLVDVVLPADFEKNGGKLDPGIQDFTSVVKDTQHKANQAFNINKFEWGLGSGIESASNWKKVENGNIVDTKDAHHPDDNNYIYKFYDETSKVYQSGVYQCDLTRGDFKYRVRLNIETAKFTIARANLPNGAAIIAYNEEGNNVFDLPSQEVLQGAKLKIGVQFIDKNYEFVQFKDVEGLVAEGNDLTKNNMLFTVAGKFIDWSKDETPSIGAEIKGADYKITFNTPDVQKGYVEVFTQDDKGEYTVKVNADDKLAYGSSIKIVLTPATNALTPNLLVNNVDRTADLQEENGKSVLIMDVKVSLALSIDFTPTTSVVVKAFVDKQPISTSSIVKSITIKGGDNYANTIDDNKGIKLQTDQEYQMDFAVSAKGVVVDKIIVSNQEIKFESTEETNYTRYLANFKVSATDPNIYISTSTTTAVSVKAESTQKVTYDGKAHAFEFTTEPTGKEGDFERTYTYGNISSEDAPSAVGTYTVTFTYNGDKSYSYTPSSTKYELIIEKATPTFATLPTVTFADDKYTCTGETTNKLEGKFEVNPKDRQPDVTKSHLVEVTFTPKDTENYNPVTFTQEALVDGKAMERTPVTVVNNNKDVQVTVWNSGSIRTDLKGEYLEGTELTIKVVYPEGVKPEDVVVKSTLLNSTVIKPTKENLSARTLIYTYVVPGGTQGEEIYVTVNSKLDWNYKVSLASDQKVTYNGKVQEYPDAKIALTGDDADPDKSAVTLAQLKTDNKISISYVGVNGLPEDAGKYSIRVQIKAGDGYQAFDETFENYFEIEKATPEIKTWPKACPISNGLTLKYAKLEGGESPSVAGNFKWADEAYTPKNREACLVKFVPDDQENYNVAYSGTANAVTVIVVDQPLVMYHTNYPEQTTITVTDATGKIYESGTPVSEGTVLTIKATTTNDKLELVSLTVNGSSITNNTYTVGNGVVAIDATFQIKKEDPIIDKEGQYAVIFPDMVRGAKISYTGDPIVERDKDFKFTVTTLAADVSKLVVKANGSTLTRAVDGSYTIKKVQEKQNVTISFSSTPTEVKVNIPLIYHEKGQPTSGRVQIINNTSNDGKYYYNDELTLIAYPETGVEFDSWSDKNKDSVRDIVLDKAEISLQAVFKGIPVTGIEDIESAAITTGKGFIMVKNVANAKATVVSISGRLQAQAEVSGDTRIDVPQGIYVVVLESGSDVKRVKVIVK